MPTRKRKSSAQARGNLRRAKLVSAGKELLAEIPLEELSLADVARAAEIPIGSVYHFFPSINNLLSEIASQFAVEILEVIIQPFAKDQCSSWQKIISCCVDRAVEMYRENKPYQQLLIGGKAPAEIKLSDRQNDAVIGQYIIRCIDQHFVLCDFPNREAVFFHTVEIIDLMLMLSVTKHNQLTDFMVEEAKRAAIAYLSCYLPRYLPARAESFAPDS